MSDTKRKRKSDRVVVRVGSEFGYVSLKQLTAISSFNPELTMEEFVANPKCFTRIAGGVDVSTRSVAQALPILGDAASPTSEND